ncbi:ABC transporter permease [Aquimarina hainanensis]|uniref:ABC transporter permease n=1 Tax=Aquimarina hainanensis TaxID=1578017 RepID=A0ABW5N744_9FLAO|nr:DUF3526 domain-containing protein [Aquimarina sp. TRL1]QKX03893.1 DUF3526 domain-containing protein [Aquimarina sp. TRL1]
MISNVIKKETKEILRDGRFRISAIILLLLAAIALLVSKQQYQNTNEQYEKAKNDERAVWEDQGDKNPHSAAHYGTYAFKPKFPLSLLDQGVEKYTGVSIFLEAHKRNEAQFSAAADQTGLSRFGELTPDFILLFIMPLIIILIGYNTYTKEVEGGTMLLLRNQGISPWKLAIGKWISAILPVFIMTTFLFIIAAIVLSSISDYGVFSWSSFIALYLVYLLYYIVFANIVLFISSRFKKSGISLVVSLAIWILACFAAPKAASNFADSKYPYPTRQEFASNIKEDRKQGLDGHDPWSKASKQLEKEVLQEYGVDSLHQLPFNFDAYRMQKGEEHEAEIYFKHYNLLKEQYQNQTITYKTLAIISPFLPTRFLSMAIANTDYQTHWDFSDTAENYRIRTQKFLNDNFAQNSKYGEWSYKATGDTWKNLPPFEYDAPSLSMTLSRNMSNIIILLFWVLLSTGALFVSTKKY